MRVTHLLSTSVFLLAAALSAGGADAAKGMSVDTTYLQKHASTRAFMLGRPVRPKPAPDGKTVLFLRAKPPDAKLALFEFDTGSGKTRQLLAPDDLLKGAEENLSPEEKARRERMRVASGGFTDFQFDDAGLQVLLSLSGRLFVLDRATGKTRELTTGPGTVLDPKFRPDGGAVAYVRGYDVFVFDLTTNKERAVTTGGSDKVTHGLAEFVAQEEMNRFSGYWWSPDGAFIVYEEADARAVEVWHVNDPFHPDTRPQPFYYPRPGKANARVRLGIVSADGGDTTWIDWDAKTYEYLTQFRWDKQGPPTITVQTRRQNELVLFKVDPKTGKTTELVRERDPAWVTLYQDVPRWLEDGGFLWTARTEAGPQLNRYSANGSLVGTVVSAAQNYRGLVAVQEKRNAIICQSGTDPTTAFVARFRLDGPGDRPDWLSKGPPGLDSVAFGSKESVYTLTSTTLRQMPHTRVFDADDKLLGDLPSEAEEPAVLPNVTIQKMGPGAGYYTALVRPHNFDAKKKYPVLLYVYGGPTSLVVQAGAGNWLIPQWLADQGFLVVAIDNRGTAHRGRDWERAVYGKFGSVPLDDQVNGLKAMAERYPEMDLDRVGVYGWSFGGYMSALAVLRRPDVFKVAIAGAPVTDWEDYDSHYTERYLGLPKDNAEAYKEASLLTYAKDLKRPLLLVHGTADDNVYFRHSLKLSDALLRADRECDVLPLSGLTHRGASAVPQHLYVRYATYFRKHLGEPAERSKGK